MARYAKVDRRIWFDARFRSLTERGKLVFLFALTHPSMTMLGAMRATIPGLAAELEIPMEAFQEAFGEALAKGIVRYDLGASLLWFPNFLKYNRPESPNVVRSWPDAFELIPECGLKCELFEQLKGFIKGLSEGFQEAFREGFPEGYAESVAVTVTGTVIKNTSEASLADDPDPVPSVFEKSELALNGSGDRLAPVATSSSQKPSAGSARNQAKADAVRRVFDYYVAACDRSPGMYTYTPARKNLLLKRLDEALKKTHGDLGKAQALMQLSVDGISGSAWHMGRDPKTDGKTYCELEKHVFRTFEQMEGWYSKCS